MYCKCEIINKNKFFSKQNYFRRLFVSFRIIKHFPDSLLTHTYFYLNIFFLNKCILTLLTMIVFFFVITKLLLNLKFKNLWRFVIVSKIIEVLHKNMYQDNPYSHVWFNKIKLILHGTLNKEFKLEQKRSEIEVNFVIEINYYQKYP